jgi:hypothetical protein
MADDCRIELFIFPDGTAIEMLVFESTSHGTAKGRAARPVAQQTVPRPEPASPAATPIIADDATVCPLCKSDLVYPTDWQRSGAATWDMHLRCPNCELRRTVTMTREGVEHFNRLLYHGAQALAREAQEISRRYFAEEATRFIAALDADLILPIDF